jgi:hypothetical protein
MRVSLIKKVKLTSKKVRANRRNGRKHLPKSNGQALAIGKDPGEPGRAAAGHENPLKGEGPHLEGASLGQPTQPAAGATAQPVSKLNLEVLVRSLEGALDDSVCPRPIHLALAAMEEEPAQFARLHQELIDEWQPSTPTLRKLVLRLAYLKADSPRSSEAEATQRDAEASVQDGGTQHEEKIKDAPKGWKLPFDTIHTAADKDEVVRKLRRELAAEHCDVATEYQVYSTLNTDFPWNLRASFLAPQDKYCGTVIWQEQALGQQVETTLRMIVTLKAREVPPLNPGMGTSRLQRRG